MPLNLHVQQSPSWVQHPRQTVRSVNGIVDLLFQRPVHKRTLGIFNSAATCKPISSAKDSLELFVRESLVSILGTHLTREHGGESPVEINQLLCDGVSFAVVCVKEGSGVGGKTVDGVD